MNSASIPNPQTAAPVRRKRRRNFVGRTLSAIARETESALFAEQTARADGFLQSIDPRVKIVGLLTLIIAATTARNFFAIILIFVFGVSLALLSRIPLKTLATRAWLPALAFTGTIALPVIFIAPGDALLKLPFLNLTVTAQGLTSAIRLILRVETTVTLSTLLVLTTLWTHVLKALRILGVPVVFVVILGMTYRYIFVLLETASNMFEARQSRTVGDLNPKQSRRIAAGSVGVLLTKSFHLNTEVYLAMQSRGFRGEVYTLDRFAMRPKDWLALSLFLTFAAVAFWLGRFDSLAALLNPL